MKENNGYFDRKKQEGFGVLKELIEQVLEPQKYGFKKSCLHVFAYGKFSVIYNSQWCRVRLTETSAERWAQRPNLFIDYGRLHAPNPDNPNTLRDQIVWNGEKCTAWWGEIDKLVSFLDGISPQKAALEQAEPDFLKPYWKSVLQTQDGNIEETLRMHRAVWERYGVHFFELFDLRRPDLWKRFRTYLEEYYKAMGWKQPPPEQYPFPPPWRIC